MRARLRDESADPEIVLNAELGKQTPVFRHMSNPPFHDAMGGHAENRSPLEGDAAAEGCDEPRNHSHQGRLSGAVRADHAHGLARRHLERHAE
jgi:hypothetical protein